MSDALEKVAAVYASNNAVRVLAEIASLATGGIYGAVDAGLVAVISDFREKRITALFDEIAAGELEITDELVRSNDFLHSYFSTINAAQRARTEHRARLYARLLKGSIRRHELGDVFSERLDVLSSLSDRELCCLVQLRTMEQASQPDLDAGVFASEAAMAGSYWDEFERLLETECGVPVGEVGPFLTRLMRTGAYQAFNVWGGDFAKPGATTPVFDDIAELLEAGTS